MTTAIYFGDCAGDVHEEMTEIRDTLLSHGISMNILATDLPPFDKRFDVLFFDWGGMSVGNGMLPSFCRQILRIADDNPGRVFVMTSQMTEYAMMDAMATLPDRPGNVHLRLEDPMTLAALRVFGEEAA